MRLIIQLHVVFFLLYLIPFANAGISFTSFGPNGEGGTSNGQSLTFGTLGSVFELDAFVNIDGLDLNGGTLGTSGQLSVDPLPAGLTFGFTPKLSADETDLVLEYEFTNRTGTALTIDFFAFVDAEIAVPVNTFFNEFGVVGGTLGAGASDADPDSYAIDEPGFVFGTIFDDLLLGSLSNTNSITETMPDDVSMALGWDPLVLPGFKLLIEVMLSEDGSSKGGFALRHEDPEFPLESLTFSGQAQVLPASDENVVPEPAVFSIFLAGIVCLAACKLRWRPSPRHRRERIDASRTDVQGASSKRTFDA